MQPASGAREMGGDGEPMSAGREDGVAGWFSFLAAFWRLAGPWWRSRERWSAVTLTAALVLLTALQVGVAIALNIWNLRFFDAVEQKALDRFLTLIGVFAVIVVANVVITTSHLSIKRRIQVDWRRWLTRQVTQEWMGGGRHHTLTYAPGRHDNPDGRIAEDVRIATEYAIDIGHSALYSTMLLASFIDILWQVSGVLTVDLRGRAVGIPGHMVWIALIYSAAGAWIALRLGLPLTRAANRRQAAEADFRFGMAHARAHSLSIALMRGEPDERRRFLRLFHGAFRAWNGQTAALRRFFYYMASWPLLNQIFPILIAAPRYISGGITLGVLMQSAQAFGQVVAALSWPIDNLAKAAEWRASCERVEGLASALRSLRAEPGTPGRLDVVPAGDCLELRGVVLRSPDGLALSDPIDLAVQPGERVMIDGDSTACGRLFRATAGLWPWGGGRILLPAGGAVQFMPEHPYLGPGRLRDVIAYPDPAQGYGPLRLARALESAGLARLADRIDDVAQWDQVFSLADRQRLGFARAFLRRPTWAVLHDAATALEPEDEQELVARLVQEMPELALVILGHRPHVSALVDRTVLLRPAPSTSAA
ncbi:MAG: ABC transporter ATP-binding protein/permease [Alphaproteobacteria bacterium]|nr:ABC transporter ATP-binding protein/permease [Alphaproteobacteria bacterium]